MFENFPQIIFKLTEILLEDFFNNLYLFLYILMVFLVFLFRFWGWLIFQPCLWGYFLGSLIVSFKNPLRVKTHFFSFFQFFNFFLLYPPLVVEDLLRDLDSPPPEFTRTTSAWGRNDNEASIEWGRWWWMENIGWSEPPSSEGFQRSIVIRKGVNFGSTKT